MDASNAGPGELTVHVTTTADPSGQQPRISVPHQLQPTGRRGLLHASFTPNTSTGHSVAIEFNGQPILGQLLFSFSPSSSLYLPLLLSITLSFYLSISRFLSPSLSISISLSLFLSYLLNLLNRDDKFKHYFIIHQRLDRDTFIIVNFINYYLG